MKMKDKNLLNIEELIQNKSFRDWVQGNSDDSFWEDFAIDSKENAQLVEQAKSFLIIYNFNEEELSEGLIENKFDGIIRRINYHSFKTKKRFDLSLIASSAIIFLIGFFFHKYLNIGTKEAIKESQVVQDEIILQTSDGKKYVLTDNKKIEIESKLNLTKKTNEINYLAAENEAKNQFHQLSVPYGKRYNIVLSDGTIVYLNSGSYLKYPVKFIENEIREVELHGEAFFEVTESKDLFVVKTNDVFVEVYGTQFNFKNYIEDDLSEVVLVEGSVGLLAEKETSAFIINPGDKGTFTKDEKSFTSERINTNLYTSWINGEIIMRNEKFDQIVKKLERIFNVSIINNKEVDDRLFNANINPEIETIDEVLSYFKEIYNIKYEKYQNKIIIK